MSGVRISVALASYNGEKYIKEQLDSILKNLTEMDEVIVSDDGSTDATWQIVEAYQKKDARIHLVKGPGQGIIANFEHAMEKCRGDYIFLADQDDIWLENKVAVVMEYLKKEKVFLVIHDARVMDEQLEHVLMPSFFAYRGSKAGFWKNITKNTYMGCCMAFRKEVRDIALPIPKNIQMHDQWIGIISDWKFGKSVFLPEKLIQYRRHEENASDFSHNTIPVMIKNRILLFRQIATKWLKNF